MPEYKITWRHTVKDTWYVEAPDENAALAEVAAGKVDVSSSEVLDGMAYAIEAATDDD